MKRFALIPALALVSLTAIYAQAPGASGAQTGQAHIATPPTNPGESRTDKRNDDANRKKNDTRPPNNPAVKAPITNPSNGPVGTPTNPK